MLCAKCGQRLSPESRFCNICGTELEAPPDDAPSHELPTGSDFVGRQREMGELVSALDDALAGKGRLVMLVGEPGIGKTRTSQELTAIAEQRGAQILWGRCYEGEGAPPYWPWLQHLRTYVQNSDADTLQSQMGPGAANIAEILPELREKLPELDSPPALEPESARFRLFDSITTFFKNTSSLQPIVLVLEDLHWADRSSLLLLEFVAREIAASRLLLIGTYRDVEVTRRHPLSQTLGTLIREQLFQSVELKGLSQQDVGQLAEATRGASLEASLLEAVYGRTEGNPLFVGEVVRLLEREEGDDGRGWDIRIPSGIRDVIGRRLDRLSEECNRALTVASVIGREFDFRLLSALVTGVSEDDLLEVLDEALEARVIEGVPGSVERYQFSHALVQQTLSEEPSISRKLRLHARIGEALEEIFGDQIERHAVELAYHFTQAETLVGSDKLVRYSMMAGEQALASYAYEEALAHFETALAAKYPSTTAQGERVEPRQAMDAEMAAILFGLGRAQESVIGGSGLSHAQQAVDNLTRAFDFYVENGDVSRAVAVAQSWFHRGSRITGIAQLLARALELVPRDSHEAGRLLPYYIYALAVQDTDYEGAQEAFGRGMAIARREQDTALEMKLLTNSARVEWNYLRPQESLEKSLHALELARGLDAPYIEVDLRWSATCSLIAMGDLEGARRQTKLWLQAKERLGGLIMHFAVNVQLSRHEGDWRTAYEFSDRDTTLRLNPIPCGQRVLLEYQVGEFSQGEAYLEQLLDIMRLNRGTTYFPLSVPAMVIPVVARITGIADRFDIAEDAANRVLSSPKSFPIHITLARVGLALIAVQLGDMAAAREQYAALESKRGTILPEGAASADRVLGLLTQTMGKLDDAAAHFEDALAFCRKAGYRPEHSWTCHDYADMLMSRNEAGDGQKARSLIQEGLAIANELGMKPLAAKLTALEEKAATTTGRPQYPDGLTEREVEVLRLIAAGKSNRQIAEELVISINTAIRHVQNIFGKTGCSNRAEAAVYAERNGLSS